MILATCENKTVKTDVSDLNISSKIGIRIGNFGSFQ